jgi:hypothetical protein
MVSALSIKHMVTEQGHVDKTQAGSLSLASPFGVHHFIISGFEESKYLTLLHRYVTKCERRLLAWPVVITNDYMEVDNGRASLHEAPIGIR